MKVYFKGIRLPFARVERLAPRYATKDIEFMGVDGFGRMNLGERGREFRVTGFLEDALDGNPNREDIEGLHDFIPGTFSIEYEGWRNENYENCILEEPPRFFEIRDMIIRGARKLTCRYALSIRQMVPD